MSEFLCISIHFLDPMPTFHGRRDGGKPEWPPSPLRLFQSLLDSVASRWHEQRFAECTKSALEWLQRLQPSEIVTPPSLVGIPFRIAVPNNDLDIWAVPISKGREPKKQPNELKTMKTIQPTLIQIGCDGENDAVHYLYPLINGLCPHLDVLTQATRTITHLGWGIDMAIGDVSVLTGEQVAQLSGHHWHPSPAGGTPLRTPKPGTLDDLCRKHTDFLNRLPANGFRPLPPLRVFDVVRYRCQDQPLPRPHAVFKLLDPNEDPARYPHAKLVHIAGMVRHLAIAAMLKDPPLWIENATEWVNRVVRGKRDASSTDDHQQFSYIPLPSIGHQHADGIIRNVMLVAPLGMERELAYLAKRIDGQPLKPEGEFEDCKSDSSPTDTYQAELRLFTPPKGKFIDTDYLGTSCVWQTVTPVILDGHNDKKPEKTIKLIQTALARAGIETPCEFTWQAIPFLKNCLSAHKYDRDSRHTGYHRPAHLKDLTAVHVRLTFAHPVPGPITLGAGRHCGLGLLAAVHSQEGT